MKTDNEKIAEFMGLTLKKEIDGIKYYNVPVGHIESYNASQCDFKYHKRWDWLMPVVEKIEHIKGVHLVISELGCDIYSFGKKISDAREETKIATVYKAVVQFIDWYTSQTLKK